MAALAPGQMLRKRSISRLRSKMSGNASRDDQLHDHQSRESILANIHSNYHKVQFEGAPSQLLHTSEVSAAVMDRWHHAFAQICIQARVVRCFREGLKKHRNDMSAMDTDSSPVWRQRSLHSRGLDADQLVYLLY